MNVSILQENLHKALTRVSRVVVAKAQIPVMQNVLLEAKEGAFLLAATSLETTEIVRVSAKVEKEGGLCVSARLLLEYVSSLPQDTVQLIVKEGSLHVSCGKFRAAIPGVAASEFPPVVPVGDGKKQELEKETVLAALREVLFAAATDEGRPLLTGVKIVADGKKITFAATDGYRLAVKELDLATKEELDLVIPARALSEVARIGEEEKTVNVVGLVSGNEGKEGDLVFVIGDTEVHTRRIDGDYPAYRKIIPPTHNTRALIEKAALLQAVKAAAIFARDNANIIRFAIDNQTIVVSANAPQIGENRVELEAKVDGEGGEIAFNSRFLLEFLSIVPGEELLFEMTGALNSGVFKLPKDESYLHIIMPVRVAS